MQSCLFITSVGSLSQFQRLWYIHHFQVSLPIGTIYPYPRYWNRGKKISGPLWVFPQDALHGRQKDKTRTEGYWRKLLTPHEKSVSPSPGERLCKRQERSNLGVVADDRGSQGRPGVGKTLVVKILMSSHKWSQHTPCMHWQAEKWVDGQHKEEHDTEGWPILWWTQKSYFEHEHKQINGINATSQRCDLWWAQKSYFEHEHEHMNGINATSQSCDNRRREGLHGGYTKPPTYILGAPPMLNPTHSA
jgi:hypothetical protein